MKTEKELIQYLMNLGIVAKVGDRFFITSRYKDLLEQESKSLDPKDTDDIVLEGFTQQDIEGIELYPKEIRDVSPARRLEAIYSYCKVPIQSKGIRKYFIQSNDKATRDAIEGLIGNPEYKPSILLDAIKSYYSSIEFPKSFRNFVKDGDIYVAYKSIAEGNGINGGATNKDNSTWL